MGRMCDSGRRMAAGWHGVGLAAVGLLALAGCGQTSVVSVDGSSTVKPISSAIAEEFKSVDPKVNVVVGLSGTSGGMKKLSAGEIDICDASRPITDAEAADCKKAGIEYVELKIAYDGIAVVTSPENNWCDSLTVAQLKTIWRPESAGTIMKWSDINPDWPGEPLKLYGPGEDSGTFDYFTEAINGKAKTTRRDYSPSANPNALVTGIAGDKGSLGYFGLAYYTENKDKLKLLSVDGGNGPLKPSAETVRDGSYKPLSRPLFIYVKKSSLANPGVVAYVKFYLANVDKTAQEVGYVPLPADLLEQSRKTWEAALAEKPADRT